MEVDQILLLTVTLGVRTASVSVTASAIRSLMMNGVGVIVGAVTALALNVLIALHVSALLVSALLVKSQSVLHAKSLTVPSPALSAAHVNAKTQTPIVKNQKTADADVATAVGVLHRSLKQLMFNLKRKPSSS